MKNISYYIAAASLMIAALLGQAAHADQEVLSVGELQEAVDLIYPRTSRGSMRVTLHSPTVEWLGDDRVKFTYQVGASTADQSARFSRIIASVSGRLFESKGYLRLKDLGEVTLDTKEVDYEYRPMVERQINLMLADDLMVEPVLKLHENKRERRYWPSFADRAVTIVGSRY